MAGWVVPNILLRTGKPGSDDLQVGQLTLFRFCAFDEQKIGSLTIDLRALLQYVWNT